MFLCSTCNIIAPNILYVNVKGQIMLNESNLSHVDNTMKNDWIHGLDVATFLSMHLENKLIVVHLLKAISICCSFSLTLTNDLIGFQEHIGDCNINFTRCKFLIKSTSLFNESIFW